MKLRETEVADKRSDNSTARLYRVKGQTPNLPPILAFSPVDLPEPTSEPACAYPHADRPGIRVAEYCLVINQWSLLLWPPGDRQRSEAMLWVT